MYQWRKNIASWKIGKTLYLSVVFSWDIERAVEMAKAHKGKVIVGGPATMVQPEKFTGIAEIRDSCDIVEPIIFHNPLASYSTRGCPNNCGFCVVPKIEPYYLEDPNFRPAPVMCDNKFLAASIKHQKRVIDKLKHFPKVDFNQGLDAHLFDIPAAVRLSELNLKARFAFDHVNDEQAIADAISLCKRHTTKDIGVYVLIGYNDTPDDAIYRLELLRSWGIKTNPMRYQPLHSGYKNEYIGNLWTERELQRIMRYYSRTWIFGHIQFSDFAGGNKQTDLFTESENYANEN